MIQSKILFIQLLETKTAITHSRLLLVSDGMVSSLKELCSRVVAHNFPIEAVEHDWPDVPEWLKLRIAYWSFPDNQDDIRLYSCLANGSDEEFVSGERLQSNELVQNPL